VPKPVASAFALLAFVVLTVPLSIAGFVALAKSGFTFTQLRRDVARPPGQSMEPPTGSIAP
jgi:hypothetical protein